MQLANLPDIQLGKSSRPGKALPDPVPSRFQRQLEPHLDLLLIAKLHLQGSWLSSINIHAQRLHIPPVGSLEAQNNPGPEFLSSVILVIGDPPAPAGMSVRPRSMSKRRSPADKPLPEILRVLKTEKGNVLR